MAIKQLSGFVFTHSSQTLALFVNGIPSARNGGRRKVIFASAEASAKKARLIASRTESVNILEQFVVKEKPLSEYMSLPATQYSVLDGERIERVDDNTFRCYVYSFNFFNFRVSPVLLVQVITNTNTTMPAAAAGCSIRLLSCKLDGSPIVCAQNNKFDATMVNSISCTSPSSLTSEAHIQVSIDIPYALRAIPVEAIESTGNRILQQILNLMLPRFMAQLVKDYQAWSTGDHASRTRL